MAGSHEEEDSRLEIGCRWLLSAAFYSAMMASVWTAPGPVKAESFAESAYHWQLPPGFPSPGVPADNPMSGAKVELGRRLFRETRLSVTGRIACISCHSPERAYTDGKPKALGAGGDPTQRSSMSLANVAYNAAYTWGDSRIDTLEAQMRMPLFNEHPIELGLKGHEAQVVERLSADESYRQDFARVFGHGASAVSIDNVIKAIAAYERTLISGRSAFDRYVFDDDHSALSPSAQRGMGLFYSERVGCARCHSGINFDGPIRFNGHQNQAANFANTGLYSVDRRGAYPSQDRGLYEVTHQQADMGKFRIPTLRNIALTGPYMHDGTVATLGEVIDHYAKGGRQWPNGPSAHNHLVDRRIRPFEISSAEKDDLIAFLESLTDPQFVGVEPMHADP
jgi:cytochrome c peroxidase